MSVIIEELKTKIDQAEREQLVADWEAYRGVLQRLHDGDTVAPAKVKAALDALGKPFSDLELDLERIRVRLSLRAKQHASQEAKPKLPALERDMEKLKTERQKAFEEQNQKIESVSAEIKRLRGIVTDGESAFRLLRETCQNPVLKLELVTLEGRLQDLGRGIQDAKSFPSACTTRMKLNEQVETIQDEMRRLNTMREDVFRRMELD